jgi:flagellar FliL protein
MTITGKDIIDKLLMAINFLAILGGLGVFVYTNVIYKRPLPQESVAYQEFLKEVNNKAILETFKLDKITTNIVTTTGRLRFLDMEAHLEPVKGKYIDRLKEKKAIIHDIVINISSRMEPDELNTVSGKILLENRIKKELNQLYKKAVIKRIYFTKFVVQ